MVNYYLIERKKDKLDLKMVKSFEARPNLEQPEELVFDYDFKVKQEINKACESFEKFVFLFQIIYNSKLKC